MLRDLVVDTNIFVHASDPEEPLSEESILFLESLQESTAFLCVDPGFHEEPARNRSLIGHEYLKHLKNGMLGYAVVVRLASSERMKPVSRAVGGGDAKKILKLVPNNVRDRTFLRVALNSDDKTLSSHDLTDFPTNIRSAIRRTLNVHVRTALETEPLLH